MPRRQLLILAGVFCAARLLLVLSASDRLSEPDSAEVKLMELGDSWMQEGSAPGVTETLRIVRAGPNAPHGAYLPVSLLYAALAVPIGEPGNYFMLKCVGILFAVAGLIVWLLLAQQLSLGRGYTTVGALALLFLLPPPTFLAGSMVPWGSHPESVFFVGLAALAIFRNQGGTATTAGDFGTALALALAPAMNLLTAPLVLALAVGWAWDRRTNLRPLLAPAIAGLAMLSIILWLTGSPWASVTETPGASPLELASSGSASSLGSLSSLLPLPLAAGVGPLAGTATNWGLTLLFALGLVGALYACWKQQHTHPTLEGRMGRVWALLLAAPIAHGLCLLLWAPRRPFIPPRYLLPIVPIFLLALVLALSGSRGWGRRGLFGAAVILAALPGLSLQLSLIEPSRMQQFSEYRPAPWLAADIGHVRYDTAPDVNRFLEIRGLRRTAGFNFATGMGASDALPQDTHDSSKLDAAALLARRQDWLDERKPSEEGLKLVHENIGWGMVVFSPRSKGAWHAILTHLDTEHRASVARGIGMGLGAAGKNGCLTLRDLGGPDREAITEGFEEIRPVASCDPS